MIATSRRASIGASWLSLALLGLLNACGSGSTAEPPPPPPVDGVLELRPTTLDLAVGETGQLEAWAVAADGSESRIAEMVTWSVDDEAIASVDSLGRVEALAVGTTEVTAAWRDQEASAPVVVTADGDPLFLLTIEPGDPTLVVGERLGARAFAASAEGETMDVTEAVEWSVDDDLVTVDGDGHLDARRRGSTVLRAALGELAAATRVTVTTNGVTVSPANNETGVAVTRETFFRFAAPLAESTTVDEDVIFASLGGTRLPGRLLVSSDRRTVTLFYDDLLPSGAVVELTVDGDRLVDANGEPVDADGDGMPGGTGAFRFVTNNLALVEGTTVFGRVFASATRPGGGGTMDTPLEGVVITVDGVPAAALSATTDVMGNFRLEGVPAGRFFVHIDGTQVTTADGYYPNVGKTWVSVRGMETSVGEVYLPLVPSDVLTEVSDQQATRVEVSPTVATMNPELQGTYLSVPAGALVDADGPVQGQIGFAPVPPDRLPGALPPEFDFPIVITIQTDGATNFDVPVGVCFPNLPDRETGLRPAPGAQVALWSFNHDTGEFEVAGPARVSEDGQTVCSEPGFGAPAPGWHGIEPGSDLNGPGGGQCPSGTPPRISDWGMALANCALNFVGNEDNKTVLKRLTSLVGLVVRFRDLAPALKQALRDNASIRDRARVTLQVIEAIKPIASSFARKAGATASPLDRIFAALSCVSDGLGVADRPCMTITSRMDCFGPLAQGACAVAADLKGRIDTVVRLYNGITGDRMDRIEEVACALLEQLIAAASSTGQPLRVAQATTELERLIDQFLMLTDPIGRGETVPDGDLLTDDLLRYYAGMADAYSTLNPGVPGAWMRVDYGTISRAGRTNALGRFRFVVAGDTVLSVSQYDPVNDLCGSLLTRSAPIGRSKTVRGPALVPCAGPDRDGDSLSDTAEAIIGTNPLDPDTDGDGVNDGVEVRAGEDPLSGISNSLEIVHSASVPGRADRICASPNLIFVGSDSTDLSVFNAFNGMQPPLRVAELSLTTAPADLACTDPTVLIAGGAGGVHVVDLSTTATLATVRTIALAGNVSAVALDGPIGFAATRGGAVVSIDLRTNTVIERLAGFGPIDALAVDGATLYVVDNAALYAVDARPGLLQVLGSAALQGGRPTRGRRIFVSADRLFVAHRQGYTTYNISRDPNQPLRETQASSSQLGWKHVVDVGNGLGLAAVGANTTDDGPHNVSVLDLSDPAATNLDPLQTPIATPGLARDVVAASGLGYVADSASGLQVLNIGRADFSGQPPVITLDAPPSFEENQRATVRAQVADDFRVRSVEFHVDNLVVTDNAYPYAVRFRAPSLQAQTSVVVWAQATDTAGNTSMTAPTMIPLTPDITDPFVLSRVPRPDGFVAVTSVVGAFFSEPMDPASPGIMAMRVEQETAPQQYVLVAQGGRVDPTSDFVAIRTNMPLTAGRYRVTIPASIADLGGRTLGVDDVWTFDVYHVANDTDRDCLEDTLETTLGLDPNDIDSDNDGILDGEEDTDQDGVPNCREVLDGRDPSVDERIWTAWPMPSPAPMPSQYSSASGVVTDNDTGLSWFLQATGGTTWSGGLQLCRGSTLGGFNDWRLPYRIELISLLDYSGVSPALESTIFSGQSGGWHWTASSYESDQAQAWAIQLDDGRVVPRGKSTGGAVVRCVRP